MRIAIIGLAQSGKSTVFTALTGQHGWAADGLLESELTPVAEARRPAPDGQTVEIIDTPGLCRGASLGRGTGGAFLRQIADVDLLLMVVRLFGRGLIAMDHPDRSVDGFRDARIVDEELAMSDASAIREWLGTDSRGGADKGAALAAILSAIEHGQMARTMGLAADELRDLTDVDLLTAKPLVLIANVDEEDLYAETGLPFPDELRQKAEIAGTPLLVCCAKLEADSACVADADAETSAGLVDELTGGQDLLTRIYSVCEHNGLFA